MGKVTALYRVFDRKGRLLYVGISGRPFLRFQEHQEKKPWWADGVRIEVEGFGNRLAALSAEATAIREERPAFNVAGSTYPVSARPPDWYRPWTPEPSWAPYCFDGFDGRAHCLSGVPSEWSIRTTCQTTIAEVLEADGEDLDGLLRLLLAYGFGAVQLASLTRLPVGHVEGLAA